MSAQTDLKARAKSAIVNQLTAMPSRGIGTSDILVYLTAEGYKVSPSTIRRYMAELIEEGLAVKEDSLFKSSPQVAEEVVVVEVQEPVVEEKIAKIIKNHAYAIIKQGRTAEITITFTDGMEKQFAANSMERLDFALSKIIPDEDLVGAFSVGEVSKTPTPVPPPSEMKKDETKKPADKKGNKPPATPKEKPSKPSKPAKPAKPAKYTRANALADVLKQVKLTDKRMTKADLIMHSNNQYIGHGGKDNLKEAKWYFNNVIGILELMGTIKVDGEVVEVA